MIKNPLAIAFAMSLKEIKQQYMFAANKAKVDDAEKEIAEISRISLATLRQMQSGNNIPSSTTMQRLCDSSIFKFEYSRLEAFVSMMSAIGKKINCFSDYEGKLNQIKKSFAEHNFSDDLVKDFTFDVKDINCELEKYIRDYFNKQNTPQRLVNFLRADSTTHYPQRHETTVMNFSQHRKVGALSSSEISDIGSSHLGKYWNLRFDSGDSYSTPKSFIHKNFSMLSQRSVVIAPGGYGKTTLVRGICAELELNGNTTLYISAAILSQKIVKSDIESILDKIATLSIDCDLIVIDGVDDFIKFNSPKTGVDMVRDILDLDLYSDQKLIITLRTEHYQLFFSDEDFLGFSCIYLLEWKIEQLNMYFDSQGVIEWSKNLTSVLRIPFYAELYSKISDAYPTKETDKYSLVQEYITRDINGLTRVSEVYSDIIFRICEEIAWQQRKGAYLGSLEIKQIIMSFNAKISVDNLLSFSIISIRFGEVIFTHDLYREHFIARRIINKMLYSNYLSDLADFQTSYEEDSFIAEVVSKNDKILKQLISVDTDNICDIEAVNLAGILSKTLNSEGINKAIDITLSKPAITELYRKAVVKRLRLNSSEQEQEKIDRLNDEIASGGDPIAAYFMVESVKDSQVGKTLKRETEKKYPTIFSLWSVHDAIN